MSMQSGTSILEKAKAAKEAADAQAAAERQAYEAERRARVREEWAPVITTILAQVEHQLGGGGYDAEEDADSGATYYDGAGWVLKQPDTYVSRKYGDQPRGYTAAMLHIDGLPVPVACWSDGKDYCFDAAGIEIDDDCELWLGANDLSIYQIRNGNDDCLVAIADADAKNAEYYGKKAAAEQMRHAANEPKPAQEPKRDTLESAGEMLRRFAAGVEIMQFPVDADISADDALSAERAFLIAGMIFALAQEVRSLTNATEAQS